MGGALLDPSLQKYVRPLMEASWSPVILQQFFAKYTGRERPFVRVSGSLSSGEVRFTLAQGEVVGVDEAHGEEIMQLLLGMKKMARGSFLVREGNYFDEMDRKAWAYQVGFLGRGVSLYPELTVEQNWRYFGRQYGLTKHELDASISSLSYRLGLEAYMRIPVHQLNPGLVRYADLGCALVHDPKLVLVHDPSSEMHPQMAWHFYQVLQQEKTRGKSIVVTGSSEVLKSVCDRQVSFNHALPNYY
ncbi:MAG: hypothetical protein ACE5FT_00095 [Candidatus Nanoarchaeia archaeon]